MAFCAASNRCCIFCPVKGNNVVNCRCGPLIDLCRGPHVRHTGKIKALKIHKVSPQECRLRSSLQGPSVGGKTGVVRWAVFQMWPPQTYLSPFPEQKRSLCQSLGGCDAPKGTVETNIVPAVCLSVCLCVQELIHILGREGGHGNPPENLRDLVP